MFGNLKMAWAGCVALSVSACASAQSGGQDALQVAQSRYNSFDTPITALLADPAARAVLERHVPQMVQGASRSGDNTLRSVQGYAAGLLTDERLALIDAELARITPAHLPVPVSAVNVNEARVPAYTLPDPLRLANGQRVRDAEAWWNVRRPQILELYEANVYGRSPGRPADTRFEVFDAGTPAFGGRAIRKQVMIHLSSRPGAPAIQLVQYIPASATGPVPMFLMIHFTPIHQAFNDPAYGPAWCGIPGRASASRRQHRKWARSIFKGF